MPFVHTWSCLPCPVLSCPVPLQSMSKRPAWAQKFLYIFKVRESWKQMISDNSLACRYVSSTKALWPATCYWNNPLVWLPFALGLWLQCDASEWGSSAARAAWETTAQQGSALDLGTKDFMLALPCKDGVPYRRTEDSVLPPFLPLPLFSSSPKKEMWVQFEGKWCLILYKA